MHHIQQENLHPIRATILQQKEELAENKRKELAEAHSIYIDLTTFRIDLLTIYADSILMEKDLAIDTIKQ